MLSDHFRRVYRRELKDQCSFACIAADDITAALRCPGDPVMRTFRALHSFMTHVAQISRLCWPGRPKRLSDETDDDYRRRHDLGLARGDFLRQLLDLPDENHPFKDRRLRDHLEHYDERLDHWASTSERRNIVVNMIGPPGMVVGIEDSDRMRTFDPNTGLYYFRGEHFSISELIVLVRDFKMRLERIEREELGLPLP